MPRSAIVIGAGIVGLATARALAIRGFQVQVIERNTRATGASIRNFGMIWPIGQPDGELYERAMLSRRIWKEVAKEAGLWYDKVGSMHMAYHKDEWDVLQELAESFRRRNYLLLNPAETKAGSAAIVTDNLLGSLYSPDEMLVDPREAIAKIPTWLSEKWGVKFCWGKAVTDVSYPAVYAGMEEWEADEIFVCSGMDFETLYPQTFRSAPLTKCKLQMLRMEAQPGNWRIGPALCGGLSLLHYNSFKTAASLPALKHRIEQYSREYLEYGIHVMVSQQQHGGLTIGDSHEYGLAPDPFDRIRINELILDYLKTFARFKNETVTETWHGVYAKSTDGATEFITEPEQGVTIINGLGGAGMTLSFGLCEQLIMRKTAQYTGFAGF